MFGLSFLKSLPGKLLIAALALTLAYGAGYLAGKKSGRIDQLQATVKAHEDRNDIDETVADLDAVARCVELGGLPDDCAAAVRRLEEDTATE